jgi:putative resolvase
VAEVVAEVGAGVGGRRLRSKRLLADPTVAVIVVKHGDLLARLGMDELDAALAAHDRRLAVVGPGESRDDLVHAMIEVLTGFCARLYGRGGARNRAMRAVICAKQARDPCSGTGT